MVDCRTAPPIVQNAYRRSMDAILHETMGAIDIRPTATTSPKSFADTDNMNQVLKTPCPGRHTFDALPSTMCEYARQAMDEVGSQSLPPHTGSSHVHHLRVYGRTCEADAEIGEREQAGDAFVDVTAPSRPTVWTRGKPALIEWQVVDSAVASVRIELMEQGSCATTIIATEAPNTGSFSYSKVPWGMECGSNYLLRISSSTDPSRYMTTAFFSISSAP
ncbi:hypothetical protein Poli38472_009171 [Pythium oligandrum]|uniref:Yeast cell wall synthesis Kre9/Knh1-like N-terminal domain-containing protein n=1 Tax=Pythium oligandrum TaxID=41045 RepID=A0A8K1CK31_PYTOL|nr:hypothetical protein Poli38472_009171 [Pythium oligandrum]|eukprot:TMW65004.1 hypothetical protein Poli38472_009171 [Pythium oligandrum]